jgi:hypothetical protein
MIVNPHVIEKLQLRENLGSTQKFSANIEITPEVDEAVDYIAKYLFEYINKDYFSYIEAHPAIRQSLGDIAIRTYKTYDAYGITNQEFPLLKVYRVSDSWKPGKLLRNSSISISYSLVLPQQDKLMPLLNWMSYEINKHLLSPNCQVKIDPGVRVQYRTMINEVGQAIYSFLRADINITD